MKTAKVIHLTAFQNRFNTNLQCRKQLFKQRWPNGFVCPHCGATHYSYIETRDLYQCSSCKRQTSVTAHTVMHKTRTDLKKWFWAIYLCATDKGGISALALSRQLKLRHETAWLMLHKIRKAMRDRDANYLLGGLVEVSAEIITGRTKSRPETKIQVQLSISDKGTPLFARMYTAENPEDKVLREKINSTLSENTVVHASDGQNGGKEPASARWMRILLYNLRDFMRGTYHSACGKHFDQYIGEFCYRFNRRIFQGEWFDRLLTACAATDTVSLAELSGQA